MSQRVLMLHASFCLSSNKNLQRRRQGCNSTSLPTSFPPLELQRFSSSPVGIDYYNHGYPNKGDGGIAHLFGGGILESQKNCYFTTIKLLRIISQEKPHISDFMLEMTLKILLVSFLFFKGKDLFSTVYFFSLLLLFPITPLKVGDRVLET